MTDTPHPPAAPQRRMASAAPTVAAGAMRSGMGAGLRRAGSAVAAPLDAMGRLPWPVALYLITLMAQMWFAVGPLQLNTMRVLLLVMAVPLLIGLLAGRYGRILPTDILFVLHLAWATVALAVNNPDRVIQNTGSTGIEFLGGYLLARAFIRDRAGFLALCRWLALLAALTLPLAVFEALTDRQPLLQLIAALPGVNSVTPAWDDMRMGLYRVQLGFVHPIHYGMFCAICFSLCFVGLKQAWSPVRRLFVSSAIALGCFLSLSSGGLLAMILQLGLILWAWGLRHVPQRWWILLGVIILAYVAVDTLSNRRPLAVFMHYATFNPHNAWIRKAIFEHGMLNVMANPLFGIGLNDWVRPAWMPTSGSVDNFWLLTAMRYGIPGFLLLVAGCAWAFWSVLRANLGEDAMLLQFRLAWVFTFIGLTFTLVTVHVWHAVFSFVFFIFGSGMWLITARPEAADPDAPADPPPGRAGGQRFTRFPGPKPPTPTAATARGAAPRRPQPSRATPSPLPGAEREAAASDPTARPQRPERTTIRPRPGGSPTHRPEPPPGARR